MIKKTPAALALHTTTIRDLSASRLSDVRGGTLVVLTLGCISLIRLTTSVDNPSGGSQNPSGG
jgi:hypothetical protein